MKFVNRLLLAILFVQSVLVLHTAGAAGAQTEKQKPENKAAVSAEADVQKKNVEAYIDLLRKGVRQQKAEIMGAVMVLSADEAAKFWPIYSEYDAELIKLNDQQVAKIKEYARATAPMTDEKADDLIQKALVYQKERAELLAKTYDRVKQ